MLAVTTCAQTTKGEQVPSTSDLDRSVPVPGSTPEAGDAEPRGPPSLTAQRYTEDYRYLRDPGNRTGAWWERLKYIPLGDSGWAYLTVGDEVRFRFERRWNYAFGSARLPDEGPYLRYRQFPYADLHLGDSVRVFAQPMIAYGTRSELVENPYTDQTGFEVGQLFVEWRTTSADAGALSVRAGRHVLVYGSGRLINAGPNIRTRFDGGVVQWILGSTRVDLFAVKPVRPKLPSFDDWADPDITVWSAYATHVFRAQPKIGLDLYYIGQANADLTLNTGRGGEVRHTLGTRSFGDEGGLFWDVEAVLQVGRFGGKALRAWGVSGQSRYTLRGGGFEPWLGVRLAATSGDADPTDDTVETFHPMFPQGGYYGESGVIGPMNMLNAQGGVGANVGAHFEAVLTLAAFFRESTGDGVYDISGALLRPDSGSRARYVGTQPEVGVTWKFDRTLSLFAVYSVVFPGRFIAESGPNETVHFAAMQTRWRF